MSLKIDKLVKPRRLPVARKEIVLQKELKRNGAYEPDGNKRTKLLKILHLEDFQSDAKLVHRQLKKANIEYEGLLVDNKADYITALKNFSPDIILADHTLPSFDSFEALKILKKTGTKIPFILVTATVSEEYAASVMREGADDYILKDRPQRLPVAILNVLEKYRIENEREAILKKVIASEAILAIKNKQLIDYNQIVSHDLRSPITSIMLISDVLQEVKDDTEKNKLMDRLKIIATNINEILNVLVDIAKIDASNFNAEPLLFKEVFKTEYNTLSIISKQLNATFVTDFSQCPYIYYSKTYLQSIFLNLISNSLKYYSPKRSPVILIKTYKRKAQIILEYSDNGLGIDIKKFGHNLFGLNQTFHQNVERKGLGLFMIKNQVESKGGKIRAESKANKGIKFIIEFAAEKISS